MKAAMEWMRTSRTGSFKAPRECSTLPQKGFTLIELIVVMAILALSMAIVMPYFSRPGDSLEAEARELRSAISATYESSVSRKTEASILFDLKRRTVKWESGRIKGSSSFPSMRGVEIPSRGLVSEGSLEIFLSPSGMNEQITVTLVNEERRLDVVFNPISGRTKVIDPEKNQTRPDKAGQ